VIRDKGTAWFLDAGYNEVLVEVNRIFEKVYEPPTATQTPANVSGQPKPQPPQEKIAYAD
jgi:hypothetical protein